MYEDKGQYKDFEYYLQHKEDFRKTYPNKSLILKDQKVVGVYDTYAEAWQNASKIYDENEYHIQLCYFREDHYYRTSKL